MWREFDASPEIAAAGRAITRCDIKIADILDLDKHYTQASLDIILVLNILHHVTDVNRWRAIFDGIRRVLSSGGLLVIREPKRTPRSTGRWSGFPHIRSFTSGH